VRARRLGHIVAVFRSAEVETTGAAVGAEGGQPQRHRGPRTTVGVPAEALQRQPRSNVGEPQTHDRKFATTSNSWMPS